MTWCVLEPARRPGDWSGEVKEKMARNKAGGVDREGHVEPCSPGEKVGLFIQAPTGAAERSGAADVT